MRELGTGLLIAVAIAVFGQILYHVVAKNISNDRSPWEVISGAYLFAFLLVFSLGISIGNLSISGLLSLQNMSASLLIGIAVVCVELGYIYSYRNGLSVSVGALSVLAITTIALVPIASLFFEEPLRISRFVGIVLTLSGVWLMQANLKF